MTTELTIYKLTVLYMLQHADTSMTNSQISEFVLSDEQNNYFRLQQSLAELAESSLVSQKKVANASYYSITEDGSSTLSFFEKDLPEDLKKDIRGYLEKIGHGSRHQILSPADYYQSEQGNFTIRCQILENQTSMLDLSFVVPTKEMAKNICLNWPLKSQEIYQNLIDDLM